MYIFSDFIKFYVYIDYFAAAVSATVAVAVSVSVSVAVTVAVAVAVEAAVAAAVGSCCSMHCYWRRLLLAGQYTTFVKFIVLD